MQRNPHSYQIATGYRTFYSLSLIYQPITKKRLFFTKKYLHVCIKTIDDGPVHNCGRCYKCLRTLAAIDILGKLPEYETIFDQSYYKTHKAAIFAKYLGYRAADPFFADILNFAKQKGFRISKMAYLLSVKYYLLLPAYMLGRELPNPTKKKIKKFLRMKG